jgi:hypothetical protein
MDRGRAGDGSYSMPADGQRQGRRWITCRQMDRGRAGDRSYRGRVADAESIGRYTTKINKNARQRVFYCPHTKSFL